MVQFKVIVPPNYQGGQKMRIQTPDGKMFDLTLPMNVRGGDELIIDSNTGQVQIPNRAPQVRQQPMQGGYPGQMGMMPYQGQPMMQGYQQPMMQGYQQPGGYMTQPVQPVMPMQITVPQNVYPGQQISVQLPSGQLSTFVVPPGYYPGSQIPIDSNTGQPIMAGGQFQQPNQPIVVQPQPAYQPNFMQAQTYQINTQQFAQDYMYAMQNPQMQQSLPQYESWFTFRPGYTQSVPEGLKAASTVSTSDIVQPTGRHKALLIGLNYPGTRASLRGCVNDVHQMQNFLQQHGFTNTPETMVLLIDEQNGQRNEQFYPTKANIVKGMHWLIHNTVPGDTLFFHYSGHGAQQTDNSGHEKDGMNETVLPADFEKNGMITDDEIWNIMISRLPSGVKLIALMDCCHCGTGMDLSFNWDKNQRAWAQEPNPSFTEGDITLFSGCDDHQTSADAYNKLANAPGGAMTTSFINCYNNLKAQKGGDHPTFTEFISSIQRDIKVRGFDQIPQLSSSQRWDPNQRKFDLNGPTYPNSNAEVGKMTVQHFKPQKPNFGTSPLGPMLLAAGIGVLVAPVALAAAGMAFDAAGNLVDSGALGDAADAVGDFGRDAVDVVGDSGGEAVNAVGDFGADAGNAIGDFAGDAGNTIGDFAGDAGDVIGDTAVDAGDVLGDVAGDAGNVLEDAGGAIGDFFGSFF